MSLAAHTHRPSQGWAPLNLGELWEHRELLYFLTWRHIKVRYRQTVLGIVWAIIPPFFTAIAFSIFFGRLAKIPSDGMPYPLFSYSALVAWNYFAQSLTQVSNSLLASSDLIRRAYFPRLVIPLSSALSGLVDCAAASLVLPALMAYYEMIPTIRLVFFPFFILLALTTALGLGIWFSVLNVRYRDVRFVVPFLIQFWFFITPVAYPARLLAEPWRTLYGLNPLAGVVEGVRWTLSGRPFSGPMLGLSCLISWTLLVSGVFYFRKMEKNFADVL